MTVIDPAIRNYPVRVAVKERADELGVRYKINTRTGKAIFVTEDGQERSKNIGVILAQSNMKQPVASKVFAPAASKPVIREI